MELMKQKTIEVQSSELDQMRAAAFDASKVYVDAGKHLYLVATRKGGVLIGEPITVRLGWTEFMQVVAQLVTQALGFRK